MDNPNGAGYAYIGMEHFAKAKDAIVKAQQNRMTSYISTPFQ